MVKLTLLLCGTMFLVLLIAGQDRGQLRPGLALSAAERPARPDAQVAADPAPAPVLVPAAVPAPASLPKPVEVAAAPAASPRPPKVAPTSSLPVPQPVQLRKSDVEAQKVPASAVPFSVGTRTAAPATLPVVVPLRDLPAPDPAARSVDVPAEGTPEWSDGLAGAGTGEILYVAARSVNVRLSPSTSAPILGRLPQGTAAAVVWQGDDDWVRIEALDVGLEGYVARRLLSPALP